MSYKNYTLDERNWIKLNYAKYYCKGIDPYLIIPNCCEYMSPIERNVWSDLKSNGIRMYPQFPVLNYFLDFADPERKIGIEVDGKEFHQDKIKDMERQEKLEKLGWKIFRIKGEWTFNELEEDEFHEDEYGTKKEETNSENKYRLVFNAIKQLCE